MALCILLAYIDEFDPSNHEKHFLRFTTMPLTLKNPLTPKHAKKMQRTQRINYQEFNFAPFALTAVAFGEGWL